jgi:hypothetical protein
MSLGAGKVVRYLLLVVSALGIVVVSVFLFNLFRPLDSLGEANDHCARQDFPSVPNGGGMVATVHLVDCTYGLAHGAETTFIYVHKSGEKDSEESLVFRFDNLGNLDVPQITWSDNSSLYISITEVGEVTKQVNSVDGMKIGYSIGKIDVSPQEYSKLTQRYGEILFAVLVFLGAICGLSIRSIRKLAPRAN